MWKTKQNKRIGEKAGAWKRPVGSYLLRTPAPRRNILVKLAQPHIYPANPKTFAEMETLPPLYLICSSADPLSIKKCFIKFNLNLPCCTSGPLLFALSPVFPLDKEHSLAEDSNANLLFLRLRNPSSSNHSSMHHVF